MVLPQVDAGLNALCTLLLVAGLILIKSGHRKIHQYVMTTAMIVSAVFLAGYLTYHYQVGSVKYVGAHRDVYLGILLSHTVLAASLAVLVPWTAIRAWRGLFDRHARIAWITLPIWLYVSITGVVVYLMLYGRYN